MTSSLSAAPLTPHRLRASAYTAATATSTANLTPSSTSTLLLPRHSPSSALHLHHSEDPLVFQIGTRNLQAGYPSEPHPRCILPWTNPEFWKRSGDLWGSGGWYSPTGTSSASRGELWHNPETIEDVLERGVRVAYNKYLLLDSKTRRIVLLVKTEMDVGALSKVVKSLFVHFQMPAVMLLQEPVMAVVGAGVRSGLVLDVGWSEAVVNVVYEMRVVGPGKHSRRGGRTYRDLWRKFLREEYSSSSSSNDGDNDQGNGIADWEIEEILSRTGWCRQSSPSHQQDETTITIPLITPTPPKTLTLPFTKLSLPAEKAFFATTTTDSPTPEYPDDDDYSLPELVYRVLRDCPIDVRAAVMQRIIITGGGSYVPGLKKRVIDEVRVLAKCRGWERVGRRVVEKGKGDMPAREEVVVEEGYQWRREATSSPEGQNDKSGKRGGDDTGGRGRIAGVESFGSWVGASLVAGMKVRGTIEVEREKFLAAVAAGGTGFPLDV